MFVDKNVDRYKECPHQKKSIGLLFKHLEMTHNWSPTDGQPCFNVFVLIMNMIFPNLNPVVLVA